MIKEKIVTEESLLERLLADITECRKDKIVLQAGHFPLFYSESQEEAIEAISYWGEFSRYTLELACQVGQYAQSLGKSVQFAFFVDDHSYDMPGTLNSTQRKNRRKKLYQKRSGLKAELPAMYKQIMEEHGFSEKDVLRQDHKRFGRESCLYFSEYVLRESVREIGNACAREYVEFVETSQYFDKEQTHLVSFVPFRCHGHICEVALEDEITGLSASHIFMETMASTATREELYRVGRGVLYRKD